MERLLKEAGMKAGLAERDVNSLFLSVTQVMTLLPS